MSNSNYLDSGLTNKIAKSENLLHKVMTKCDISPAGQAYVDMYIDPFKDILETPCLGFIDASTRNVNMHHYKNSVTISAPPGLAPGQKWACHAFAGPLFSDHIIEPIVKTNDNLLERRNPELIAEQKQIGGLNILTGPDQTLLGFDNIADNIAIPTDFYLNSNSRAIYGAFECHNITPKIYVSGDVLTYRKTELPVESTVIGVNIHNELSTIPHSTSQLDTRYFDAGIGRYDDLQMLPGSKIYPAATGNYSVMSWSSPNLEPGTDKAVASEYTDAALGIRRPGYVWYSKTNFIYQAPQPAGNYVHYIAQDNQPFYSNFNTSGAYYTGLTPETVLKFSVVFGIEEAPRTNEIKLMSLAHVSPAYDPCAIELCSKMNHVMPTGVPVTSNGSGDYLSMMAELAALVGIPGSNLLMKGAQPLGNLIDGWIGLQNKQNPTSKPLSPKSYINKSIQAAPSQQLVMVNKSQPVTTRMIKSPVQMISNKPAMQVKVKKLNKKKKKNK